MNWRPTMQLRFKGTTLEQLWEEFEFFASTTEPYGQSSVSERETGNTEWRYVPVVKDG